MTLFATRPPYWLRDEWESKIDKALKAQGWPTYKELQEMSWQEEEKLSKQLRAKNPDAKPLFQIEQEALHEVLRADRLRKQNMKEKE